MGDATNDGPTNGEATNDEARYISAASSIEPPACPTGG